MEKILLKPIAQEITIKNDEPGVFYDAFSYTGSNLQERNLGNLFVVGQVKYGEENLGYLVNLIASLAKREYYAKAFMQNQTPRSAFEDTLKKLNEVMEDFFKNKQFKLSVGLASVAGDNLLISRIGNVRVSLARNGDHIDVLNNIELFEKEHIEEKEFSNVISGKVQSQDKLFMYLPLKTVTSREKTLKDLFKKEPQAVFAQKLDDLSKTAANFACCGIHMEINSVKEIPVQSRPSYSTPKASIPAPISERNRGSSISHPDKNLGEIGTANLVVNKVNENQDDEEDARKDLKGYKDLPQPRIIPADVSLARGRNVVASLTGFLGSVKPGPFIKKSRGQSKMIGLVILGLIIVIGGAYLFFFRGGPDAAAVKQADKDLELAQEQIEQNNYKSARTLIDSALSSLSAFDTGSAKEMKEELSKLLASIDKTSEKTPSLFLDLSNQGKSYNNILATAEGTFVLDQEGNFALVHSDGKLENLSKINIQSAAFVLDGSKDALLLNLDAKGSILNKTNGKSADYSLDGTTELTAGAVYADNLYALSGGSIMKFTDAALGKTAGSKWSQDTLTNGQAITADGNIYILTTDGKLLTYFQGEKKSEFDLNLTPSSDASIFTLKDLPFIYLVDKSNKKVMVFDKASGSLQTTYSLSATGSIKDVSVTKDQTIYVLSSDNKIWVVK